MPDSNSGDQTEEIVHDLLQAERQKEITQATTLQGQIVALVLILVEGGTLDYADVNRWEGMSEHVQGLLQDMAIGSATEECESNSSAISLRIKGLESTLELLRLMGNDENQLEELVQEVKELRRLLKSTKED